MDWLRDRIDDVRFWWKDRPIRKFWRGFKDRVDAFIFCIMLLVVGVWSPKLLRQLMIDALKDSK